MKEVVPPIKIGKDQKADFSLPFEFPMRTYQTNLAEKPLGINSWHWHSELQFCIVDQGELTVAMPGKEFHLHEGDGYFIQSGVPHTTRAASPKYATYRCLNADASVFSAFHGSALEQHYFLPYQENERLRIICFSPNTDWEQESLELLESIFDELARKSFGYELVAYGKLLLLWKQILEQQTSEATSGKRLRSEAKNMLRYLQLNYSAEACQRGVASAVHLSAAECCRIFKKSFGCTMTEYLTEYRLQQSILLLTSTSQDISEIAFECGFHSASYFSMRFRERMGLSPSEYRKKRY